MSDVREILLQQKIDAKIKKMKRDFVHRSGFFSAKENAELLGKAVNNMAILIENNERALEEIRKLQDFQRDPVTDLINLDDYVPVDAHNNLLKSYDNLKLSVKENQRMNNEKNSSINKLKKKCTSMHKENTRLRAEVKALKSKQN